MIDFTKSKQYTLSIRLSTDGFSFSIYNPIHDDSLSIIEKEIDTSLSLTANLKAVFHESDFLNHPYKRVNIMMASKRFTIAPLDLFEEGQAELLFYHNHQKRENETVLYNILRKNNVAVIFGIDKSAQTFLNEQYPEARFYSQSTPFIDYFSVKSRLGNSKKMYASVRKDGIDIYCFERGHLLLANSFECTHTEDRIYYLLYAWKQLEFNQERDELHLTGILPEKDVLMSELKKFTATPTASSVFTRRPRQRSFWNRLSSNFGRETWLVVGALFSREKKPLSASGLAMQKWLGY